AAEVLDAAERRTGDELEREGIGGGAKDDGIGAGEAGPHHGGAVGVGHVDLPGDQRLDGLGAAGEGQLRLEPTLPEEAIVLRGPANHLESTVDAYSVRPPSCAKWEFPYLVGTCCPH